MGLLGLSLDDAGEIYNQFLGRIADINTTAVLEGSKFVQTRYDLHALKEEENILINGNQAVALGALAAGCKFIQRIQ